MNATTHSIARACTAHTVLATPLGPLLLARTAQGLAGAWFEAQRHHPAPFTTATAVAGTGDDPLLHRAASQFAAYFDGHGAGFDVPLDLHGTPFQRSVWHAMLALAPGSTCSYGELARRIGSPSAVRAVGAAVGRNPLSVIVPCHRILGGDGGLTGYAGGLDRKRALLALEQRRPGALAA